MLNHANTPLLVNYPGVLTRSRTRNLNALIYVRLLTPTLIAYSDLKIKQDGEYEYRKSLRLS